MCFPSNAGTLNVTSSQAVEVSSEVWSLVEVGSEVWSLVEVGSEVWSLVEVGSEVWSLVEVGSEVWSLVEVGSEVWSLPAMVVSPLSSPVGRPEVRSLMVATSLMRVAIWRSDLTSLTQAGTWQRGQLAPLSHNACSMQLLTNAHIHYSMWSNIKLMCMGAHCHRD